MTAILILALSAVVLLVPVCFLQLLYLESLRLRTRELPSLEWFKEEFEDRVGQPLERGALTFSLVKHALLVMLGVLMFAWFERGDGAGPVDQSFPWRPLIESMVVGLVAMVALTYLVPQVLYRRTSGKWLLVLLPLIRIITFLMRPLLALLGFLKSLSELNAPEEDGDEGNPQGEDIEALISAGAEEGLIEEGDRKLIQSVVEFGDKTVREVMTPRPNIVAIDEDASLEDLRQLMAREQYSRVPVYEKSIDRINGFVHIRDLVEIEPGQRAGRKVRDLRRDIVFIPETKPVGDLMRQMQLDGFQMAVVVDEYGETAGIATMEDLVEEIVGEITDEHDPESDFGRDEHGACTVSGNFDLDHLADMFDFRPHENTESTTIGGLVSEWLGHVPAAGEIVEREGLRIEVLAADQRRVSQVRVSRKAAATNGDHGETA